MYSNDCLTYLLERSVDIVESVHKSKIDQKNCRHHHHHLCGVCSGSSDVCGCVRVRFVSKMRKKLLNEKQKVPAASDHSCMIGRTHARRIIRAEANDDVPSPFTSPVLITPDGPPKPNRPPLPTLPPTAIDGLVAPPPTETRRGTAMPETLVRDVGGRRPEGRRKPAPVTLDGACVCAAACLFRWG
jgi:hypothetical protein